jgi:hypothetical protein
MNNPWALNSHVVPAKSSAIRYFCQTSKQFSCLELSPWSVANPPESCLIRFFSTFSHGITRVFHLSAKHHHFCISLLRSTVCREKTKDETSIASPNDRAVLHSYCETRDSTDINASIPGQLSDTITQQIHFHSKHFTYFLKFHDVGQIKLKASIA